MKLSLLSAAAVLLAPALASAQQITIEDDGTLRVNRAQQGGYVGITASGSLCTDYNSNNGFAGNMFDIEPVLDLRLPEELAEELKPAPSSESIRLLPPLFDTGESSRSMQIGGRLISGEAEDESLIEGAEIQFELKR